MVATKSTPHDGSLATSGVLGAPALALSAPCDGDGGGDPGDDGCRHGHDGLAMVFLADRNGLHVRTLANVADAGDFELVGLNASWLIFYFFSQVHLWRLVDGCVTDDERNDGIRLDIDWDPSGFAVPMISPWFGCVCVCCKGEMNFLLEKDPGLRSSAERHPVVHHLFYLDDGTLIGPTKDCLKAFTYLQNALPKLGLHLNPAKCTIFNKDTTLMQNNRGLTLSPEGIKVLGSFIGEEDFVARSVKLKVNMWAGNIHTLEQLKSFQLRLLMLRHTLAQNPNYLCRTTPTEGSWFTPLNSSMYNLLQGMLKSAIPPKNQGLVHWPAKQGGLGLPNFQAMHKICIQSSWHETQHLPPSISSQPPYVDPIPEKIVQELQGKQPTAKLQKKIARLCFEENKRNWMENASLTEKAIVQSNKAHMASRWTKVIPSIPQLTLSNDSITLCMAHCLCVSAVPNTIGLRRVCCCGHALDPHDTHLLSCKRGGLQIRRHDAVVNLLYQLAKQAGVTVQKEVSNETEGRIDLLVEDNPPPQILDISIVCPNISPARQIPKSLDNASKQEQRKRAKWLPRCSDRYVFTPVCWESTGAPTELTCSFVNSLISVLDDKEFEPPNWACRTPKAFWWDKLYTSIINNTAAHLRRVTTNTAP
ncbi:hypothetical protein Pelo_9304 [Pelomyxa schiedti]|nr:hypothetical protein Pelo_9304 [Pelomyxa schiedti]